MSDTAVSRIVHRSSFIVHRSSLTLDGLLFLVMSPIVQMLATIKRGGLTVATTQCAYFAPLLDNTALNYTNGVN